MKTGEKLWENGDYIYLYNTEKNIYGIKQKFESFEIAELNLSDGKLKNRIPESGHSEIYKLRENNEELQLEFSNYPVKYVQTHNEDISEIINKESANLEIKGDIEYILKDRYLIFNYYVNAGIDFKDLNRRFFENRLRIFDVNTGELLYSDIMNEKSTYNVPDNFFIRKNFLFYLREKKEIVSITLK